MALSSKQSMVAFVLAALAAAAAAAGYPGCPAPSRKITVQNLCGRDLPVTVTMLGSSSPLFGASTNVRVIRRGTHETFAVCAWTGRLDTAGAAQVEFHVGSERGGAWYQAPAAQPGMAVPVTVTPHGKLQGSCPPVGCPVQGKCYGHTVWGGNCFNVDELKIVYCQPQQ
ncbi:hypothetical protein ACP70R_032339 [Stipagrostis hirtigluma subsp. patula]